MLGERLAFWRVCANIDAWLITIGFKVIRLFWWWKWLKSNGPFLNILTPPSFVNKNLFQIV
jgi:hypothetical protein